MTTPTEEALTLGDSEHIKSTSYLLKLTYCIQTYGLYVLHKLASGLRLEIFYRLPLYVTYRPKVAPDQLYPGSTFLANVLNPQITVVHNANDLHMENRGRALGIPARGIPALRVLH